VFPRLTSSRDMVEFAVGTGSPLVGAGRQVAGSVNGRRLGIDLDRSPFARGRCKRLADGIYGRGNAAHTAARDPV
jgi:hypothetical protein